MFQFAHIISKFIYYWPVILYMIVEGAFYNLPETVTRIEYTKHEKKDTSTHVHEAVLSGYFVMSLLNELNSRNIQNPMEKIVLEQPYPHHHKKRCDIYTKFGTIFQGIDLQMEGLGYRTNNYIEVKFFFEKQPPSSGRKTANVGRILYDLFKLSILLKNNNDGKYLLIVFNRNKEQYLAFNKRGGKEREYLRKLFTAGEQEIHIDLNREVQSVKKEVKIPKSKNKFDLKFHTLAIETNDEADNSNGQKFHFYLIRVK